MRGGGAMDRKELLLKLCEELTKAVDYFYHEDDAGLKAFLGEVLGRYGSVLADIGWVITWADEEVQDKVFEVIEDAFRRKHLLKCRLEEWLSWKVGEIVEEALEDREEEGCGQEQTSVLRMLEELNSEIEHLAKEYEEVLGNIGGAVAWVDRKVQEDVLMALDVAFRLHEQHTIKLRQKVSEIVDALKDKGEERETQQTQTDELPF
jgi:hypothetical protein